MSSNSQRNRDAEAIVSDLKAVIAKSIAGNLELASRVRELVRSFVNQPSKLIDNPRDPRNLVLRWLDFNIASLRILTEHSLEAMDGIVSAAESGLGRTAPARAVDEDASVDLELEGRAGDRVSAAFQIENRYDRPLDVTFDAEPFIDQQGGIIDVPVLTVEPDVLHLSPREAQVVRLIVQIAKEFAAGETYESRVRLVGFNAKTIVLRLRVLEDSPKRKVSAKPARRRRS